MKKLFGLLGFCLALLLPAMAFAQGAAAPTVIINPPTAPANTTIYQGGNNASISLDGALSVLTPANPQFTDLFSTTLDTTTNWTVNNSGGTAATSAGSLVVSGTTTASQWGGLATKQSWAPAGSSAQVFGVAAVYNTLAISNSVRIFGLYTSPASPTLAAPITDGYVFRLDATGALFAEIWSAGTAVSSTNITAIPACTPTAGIPNLYYFIFRTNLTQFGCANNPVAVIAFVNPANQTLPISAYSVAGLVNPGSAATITLTGMSLSSYTGGSVKSAAQIPTINDSSSVVSFSPNVIDPCSSPNISKSSVAINVTSPTTTSLVAVSGTTTVYVCGFSMTIAPSATTADTALFEYGTGAACTSPTVLTGTFGNGAVITTTTATVVDSLSYGGGNSTIFKSASAAGICVLSAGTAVNIQGVLTYVQQ